MQCERNWNETPENVQIHKNQHFDGAGSGEALYKTLIYCMFRKTFDTHGHNINAYSTMQ